jgi:selenocysteine-specific elongation factor
MHIVGTAGHVDHGKSTLIQALTGTHPDRLKEEKDREMTIELGFASMALPGGETIGIVDVPGHLDFISNMLSGIGSIDAVLLVIAADEGVSAQTREHLAILDLLGIETGLVVMTKIDLVTDPDWLDLVEMDIRELLAGTSLKNVEFVRVSSTNGVGLDELKTKLSELLKETPAKQNLGKPRLPVDRVFTLQGFGTVVTGTLLDGSFSLGEDVVCLPEGLEGRIRGIQNHSHKLQKIEPGFRAALNLSGLSKDDIHRGDVIVHPGDYLPTRMVDLHIRALNSLSEAIHHNQACNLYIGSSEVQGQIRLLGKEALEPGGEAFLQIRLQEPVVAARGDRVVIRQASPSITLGGGEVLDPHPEKRYKRFDALTLVHLENLAASSSTRSVLDLLNSGNPIKAQKIAAQLHLGEPELQEILKSLEAEDELVVLNEGKENSLVMMGKESFLRNKEAFLKVLSAFHKGNPMRAGMPREELRSTLGLIKDNFELLVDTLKAEETLRDSGKFIAMGTHEVKLDEVQINKAAPLFAQFKSNPYSPPDQNQLEETLGAELVEGLVGSGQLVRVSAEILFSPEVYEAMKIWVQETIRTQGSLTLASFRDQFNTSRKYATAFLEHLDSIGITLRKGDFRVLRIVQ